MVKFDGMRWIAEGGRSRAPGMRRPEPQADQGAKTLDYSRLADWHLGAGFDDVSAPTFPTEDAIGYWASMVDHSPKLSRMAFGLHAIPAMSDERERTFSKAGYAFTSRRSRLGCGMIEAGECLKSWFHRGVIGISSCT